MSEGLVFAVTYAVTFSLLGGLVVVVRRLRRGQRIRAFRAMLRTRSALYAQMNALLAEFQRLARMDREAQLEAVGADPATSPTGELFLDVKERLSIARTEVDPARVHKALRPAAVALDEAIQVLLEGLEAALAAPGPQGFVDALPKASPTVNAGPLRKADGELRAFAESERLEHEEFFYQDASFYV